MRRALLLLNLLCVLAGCTAAPSPPPGYAVVGLDSGPLTLDPRYATDATASQIGALLFGGLTRLDDRQRRVPQLATSWETPDAQTYVFHLRDGVRFSNGQPLTAADVRATYTAVLDRRGRSPKQAALQPIASVDVVDRLTVRFRLRHPFAPFLDATGLGILPAAQVRAAPSAPLPLPIGSGPFHLVEFTPDDRVVLARSAPVPGGSTRLAGVIFKVVPDAITRLLELRRGDLDLVQNAIDPDALAWVRRQPNLAVATSPGTTVEYIGMNLRDPRLADVRVRRAIAYAIDRGGIIAALLKGLATPATGLLSPAHWAYSADVRRYPYDPDRARRLLDRAGYTAAGGDAPAPRLRLSYKTSTVELRRRIAEALQAQLAAVGIAVDVRTYEWATLYADIKRGNFQLYSLAWVGIEDPDIYYLTCHSSQTPPAGSNRGFFADAVMDQLTEAARRTLDPEQRRRLYAVIQQRAAALLPVIPLWWTTNVAAFNRRLRGFALHPNGSYVSLADARIAER